MLKITLADDAKGYRKRIGLGFSSFHFIKFILLNEFFHFTFCIKNTGNDVIRFPFQRTLKEMNNIAINILLSYLKPNLTKQRKGK